MFENKTNRKKNVINISVRKTMLSFRDLLNNAHSEATVI